MRTHRRFFHPLWNNGLLKLSWLHQKCASTLVRIACENLCVLWRSQWKQQQCISRCSHVHCLLPHMGMFILCLCPCVSRQDILNYFAQLLPWTLATARQYTHHTDTRTYSYRVYSSCPSHTSILLDTDETCRGKKKVIQLLRDLSNYGMCLWLSEKIIECKMKCCYCLISEKKKTYSS